MAKRTRKKRQKAENRIYLLKKEDSYTLVINEIESGKIYTVKYKGIYKERTFTAKRDNIIIVEETKNCKLKGWIEFNGKELINIAQLPTIPSTVKRLKYDKNGNIIVPDITINGIIYTIDKHFIYKDKLYIKEDKGEIIKGNKYKIIYNQKKVRKVNSNNVKQLIIRPTNVYEQNINTIMYIGKSDTVFKLSTFPIIQP